MRAAVALLVAAGALLAAGATLAACGQDAPPSVAIDEFPAAAQDALCAWSVRCRHVPDDATCRRLLDPRDYDLRRAADAIAAGRMSWDPEAAGRCVASVEDAVCAATPYANPSCDVMTVGLVPRGGACASSFECAASAPCEDLGCDGQCCTGVCGAPVSVTPAILASAGDPCSTHTDCQPGLYCELDRRCTALPENEGDHCLYGCAWGDLYCDIDTETCRRFAPLGAECAPSGIAPPCDPVYAVCDDDSGLCRPRPGPGDPCSPSAPCVASTWCDGGACVPPGGPGASCSSASQCTVTCNGDTCAPYQTCTP